jgi:hypothetical protein
MKFPTILSGPILRRVDTHSIFIWVATSRRFHIGAELFRITENTSDDLYTYSLLSDRTEAKTVHLGKRLYIYMIKITPTKGNFPTDVLLGYNLLFKSGSRTVDLNSFGLLTSGAPQSIVYGNLKYPSFFINTGENGNILYGSCRKLNGKGNDVLASADLLLEEEHHNLLNRPNSLFLLGDQIYADDVADPLLPIITFLGKILIGRRENLEKLENRLEDEPFQQSIDKIHGRQFIMQNFCQFTSMHSHNHLIKFCEYAAMYLLSWGPQLLEYIQEHDNFPTFEDELEKENIHFAFSKESRFQQEHQEELRQHETRFKEQWEDLQQNLHVLTRVQRLLANTPTYMMFDDHDVTDDWNLSRNWKDNVWNSQLGRHVVANGLGAYWAFQGWGNCPDSYSQPFLKRMKRYFNTFTIGSTAYNDWVECLWNYKSWHYIAPTEPKALFLDTRTKRAFDSLPQPVKIGGIIEENIRSPQLISQHAWQDVSKTLGESGWKSGDPLIIASPTPLYGIGLIESVLHSYVYPLRAIGIPVHEVLDFEAWKYNGKGFSEFLNRIFEWNPSHCFIVSGDVHYASSVQSTVKSKNGLRANIIQFTSSPISNMSFSGVWGMLLKSAVWFNTLKRKRQKISRYCDETYNIIHENQHSSSPSTYYWKETLHYLSTDKGAIIKTDNNLGLLSLTNETVQNSILTYKNLEKQEIPFERVNLLIE